MRIDCSRIGLVLFLIIYVHSGLWAYPPTGDSVVIIAPASPSSIPLIAASRRMAGTRIQLFTNHSQAHSLFLKDHNRLLSTGLSVAIRFYQEGIPVRILSSHIAGMTYLITLRPDIKSFGDLRHSVIVLPFEGSPIEEITTYFIRHQGLRVPEDIRFRYSPLEASVELIRQGKIQAAVLPEPYGSLMLSRGIAIHPSLDYYQLWKESTGQSNGYPQVVLIAKSEWSALNSAYIQRLHRMIREAMIRIEQNPDEALEIAGDSFHLPQAVLRSSIQRIRYQFISEHEMEQAIYAYYRIIGKPLNESFKNIFYLPAQ